MTRCGSILRNRNYRGGRAIVFSDASLSSRYGTSPRWRAPSKPSGSSARYYSSRESYYNPTLRNGFGKSCSPPLSRGAGLHAQRGDDHLVIPAFGCLLRLSKYRASKDIVSDGAGNGLVFAMRRIKRRGWAYYCGSLHRNSFLERLGLLSNRRIAE